MQKDATALIEEFEVVGNPFKEENGKLVELYAGAIMPDEVTENVNKIKETGKSMYRKLQEERILSQKRSFNAPIERCKVKLFKSALKEPSKEKSLISGLKKQQAKSTDILIAAQSGRDVESVFKHESSEHPPALTRKGKMYHGVKSEILECIAPNTHDQPAPQTTCVVNDGPVLVHMLRPKNVLTVLQYCVEIVFPYLLKSLERNQRADVVWDQYLRDILKAALRLERGSGIGRQVTPSMKIPSNWTSFLRNDHNKRQLFIVIAELMEDLVVPEVRVI